LDPPANIIRSYRHIPPDYPKKKEEEKKKRKEKNNNLLTKYIGLIFDLMLDPKISAKLTFLQALYTQEG
jgi:hypothetical protein